MRAPVVPAGENIRTADQRVFLSLTWKQFETLLSVRGDAAGPRIAYLEGVLELMSPSLDHERIKSILGRILEAYALETGLELSAYGSWTLKRRAKQSAAEPDECYVFGVDPSPGRPDLVIEVVWTSGGLEKLEIYQRLGIPEVWQWESGALRIFVLRGDRYVEAEKSDLVPGLDVRGLPRFLSYPTMTQAIRAFRASLASPKRRRRRATVRRVR